jgi:tetratricopeptide (TPR) repeat protein
LRESVTDWLARQDEDPKPAGQGMLDVDAGDTMILPTESIDDAQRDFDATLELPSAAKAVAEEMESFGTLAPEDMANPSDTTSIEMVDGGDVAERLDRLFAEPAAAGVPADPASIPEMSLFASDDAQSDAPDSRNMAFDPSATLEVPVSGADVSSRLQELFDTGKDEGADTQSAPAGLTHGSETDEELAHAPIGGVSDASSSRPAPELAPMTDEEEGYPEDEEMPSQGGAGANVATVTLAEIYFQQGLREQALQIYRQLLEREPENDTVRKRIAEIEAAKPEGGDRDPGSDPRRPRPGLKVPKRKK